MIVAIQLVSLVVVWLTVRVRVGSTSEREREALLWHVPGPECHQPRLTPAWLWCCSGGGLFHTAPLATFTAASASFLLSLAHRCSLKPARAPSSSSSSSMFYSFFLHFFVSLCWLKEHTIHFSRRKGKCELQIHTKITLHTSCYILSVFQSISLILQFQ